MLRKLPLVAIIFVALVGISIATASIMSHHNTAYADGAVGGGSGSTGGCSSSSCPYTNHGYGWYKYGVNDPGPAAFRFGGSWATARQKCIDTGNDSVIAFIVQTGAESPSSAWVYPYVASDYGTYYKYLGNNGGNWLSYGYAQSLYNSLPGNLKLGWTWGYNVAWFCYNFSKNWSINGQSYIQVAANSGVAANRGAEGQGTKTATPGNRLYWYHDMRNNGPDPMDKAVTYQVDKTGFSNGWNGIVAPSGVASGGAGVLFVQQYAPGAPYATYDVQQADVGNTLCQRISWVPGSSATNNRGASGFACAAIPYNYGLTPTITNITDGSAIEGATGSNPVTGNVSNNSGTTKSHTNIQWQITQTVYGRTVTNIPNVGGGISSQAPCAFFGGNQSCSNVASGTEAGGYGKGASKTYNGNGNIDDLDVGSHVCYAMSIKRNSSSSADWRHSKLYCLVVGKKPKVQVLGGDLIVGRGSATNPAQTSSVITSITRQASGTYYGSWAEYGIIPSGIVTGMGSAAGYAGGTSIDVRSNLCGVSLLTFTNAGSSSCSGATTIGQYNYSTRTAPNVASRFPVDSKTPTLPLPSAGGTVDITRDNLSGVYTSTTSTLAVGSTGDIPVGKWVVINAPNTTVTIGTDIHYTSAPLHNLSDIPQLVIIAKNILIADNVSNVDSWLIATGSGVDGRINTCGAGGVNESTVLNANVCSTELTVNGPVLANHLIMRRTAGAGTGADVSNPAEVFNLRADAYIWSTSYTPGTGRLPTVETTELPPRF